MSDENEQTTFNQIIPQIKMTRQDKLKLILRVGLMMLFDIGLPIVLYFVLKNYIRELGASLISCVPPLIVAIYGLISKRRVNATGIIAVITFVASAASVTLVKDDPKIRLIRRSVITGAIGIPFIISLIPIKIGTFQMRPLVFCFFKDMTTGGSFGSSSESISERWDRAWVSYQYFRRGFNFMTSSMGFGLVNDIPMTVIILRFFSPVDRAILFANISHYSSIGNLAVLALIGTLWIIYKHKQSK